MKEYLLDLLNVAKGLEKRPGVTLIYLYVRDGYISADVEVKENNNIVRYEATEKYGIVEVIKRENVTSIL